MQKEATATAISNREEITARACGGLPTDSVDHKHEAAKRRQHLPVSATHAVRIDFNVRLTMFSSNDLRPTFCGQGSWCIRFSVISRRQLFAIVALRREHGSPRFLSSHPPLFKAASFFWASATCLLDG